ncbi:MAG: hypothetical protein CO184_01945 [Candidatus Zambryskibacteria bacterium CG_4_9_14_3_um_filter_40_16]|uniref:Uncharacterized protein n=2 Tax=Candidatus Zambryskiibacteriota TaxID=1817925 RepID=A0A2H0K6Q6_9BACT|nr:MAG: hypothetical protein COV95_01395 [Candidatus Zambryskibacteria bacterium CG11_big_fil_rev_8_21_14_0_20_40_24]PJA33456.1 MAG: hypothetical protein CO184_01945 [Candidatus Zambryskibacteria bacterium CG_4_9_14_3_um_filter_40_16]
MRKYFIIPLAFIFPKATLAHCPLCTIGAGALAVVAASMGISSIVVGVFIGAFAMALGMWLSKIPKKEYIPNQYFFLTILIFLGTIIPIMPLIREYHPLYLSLVGEYGTFFHNTYAINLFFFGSVLGALIMFVSPFISRMVSAVRKNRAIPYQGIALTALLLISVSILIELISK